MVWIQIRTDILSVLIWVQIVCIGYQHTADDKGKKELKPHGSSMFHLTIMPRSHIQGREAGLATDVHSWHSVLDRSFPYCIRNHT